MLRVWRRANGKERNRRGRHVCPSGKVIKGKGGSAATRTRPRSRAFFGQARRWRSPHPPPLAAARLLLRWRMAAAGNAARHPHWHGDLPRLAGARQGREGLCRHGLLRAQPILVMLVTASSRASKGALSLGGGGRGCMGEVEGGIGLSPGGRRGLSSSVRRTALALQGSLDALCIAAHAQVRGGRAALAPHNCRGGPWPYGRLGGEHRAAHAVTTAVRIWCHESSSKGGVWSGRESSQHRWGRVPGPPRGDPHTTAIRGRGTGGGGCPGAPLFS